MPLLEICCYTLESALKAESAGADRIELCDNPAEGGTTPSLGTIQLAAERLSIPLMVIVRPRGGDFLYTQLEFESIRRDVLAIKKVEGVNGIVVGFLTADGRMDVERTREIVELAKPKLEVTFHRAFDMCRDPEEALEQLDGCGVQRILTSGGRNTAMEGADRIAKLVRQAGDDVIIMPGSGVKDTNLKELMTKTKAVEYHSSARCTESSKMQYTNPNIDMGRTTDSNEYQIVTVNEATIRRMKMILQEKHT